MPSRPLKAAGCAGRVIWTLQDYHVPTKFDSEDRSAPTIWAGGPFSILRRVTGGPGIVLDEAAERVEAITIAGRPGIIAWPTMPEGVDNGRGQIHIFIKEPFGFTAIYGDGLPSEEFIKILESLY